MRFKSDRGLSRIQQTQQVLLERRVRDQVCEHCDVLVCHLLNTVNEELQLLIVNIVHVLRAPEFQLFVGLPHFKVVVEEAEVGHNLKVSRL